MLDLNVTNLITVSLISVIGWVAFQWLMTYFGFGMAPANA